MALLNVRTDQYKIFIKLRLKNQKKGVHGIICHVINKNG